MEEITYDKFIVRTARSEFPIDGDELPKIFESIGTGKPYLCRQGLFNPSFFDTVVEDKKRIESIKEMVRTTHKANSMVGRVKGHDFEPREYDMGMIKLVDLFANVRATLEAAKKNQELGSGQ